MRIRCGVDLIEIERIRRAYYKRPQFFLRRFFSLTEQQQLKERNFRVKHMAARFAAKEAVFKVLGVGLGEVTWTEVEIISSLSGEPLVQLSGRARKRAVELGLLEIAVSLSHSRGYAVAQAVAYSPG